MAASRLRHLNSAGSGAPPPPPDQVQPGRIVNTPTSIGDNVYVLLDEFDPVQQTIGPVLGWRVTPATEISEAPAFSAAQWWPHRGAKCLVLRVDQGDDWLVAWEPA